MLEGFQGQGPELVIPLEKKKKPPVAPVVTGNTVDSRIEESENDIDEVAAAVAASLNEEFRGAGPETVFVSAVPSDSHAPVMEGEFRGAGPEDTPTGPQFQVAGAGFEEQLNAAHAHLEIPRAIEATFEVSSCVCVDVILNVTLSLVYFVVQKTALYAADVSILALIGCILLSWARYRRAISYIYAPASSSETDFQRTFQRSWFSTKFCTQVSVFR